jgi:hypothetical protein
MLVQQKSILAKLLASENLTVEHRKVSTAFFDTKNRVMVLPVWKDMSPALYDLLLGHETGHALYTPNDGWHDNLKQNQSPGFKTYLNVIEDIRIEKRIQETFPGLKVSFTKGYSELMAKDFFGLNELDQDISELAFIDRINLHYKVGSYLNVQFSEDEMYYIERLNNLKTWEDVEEIAKELFKNAKKNMRNQLEDSMNDFDFDLDDMDDLDEDEDGEEFDSDGKRSNGRSRLQNAYDDLDEPISSTDQHFRKREKEFIDDKVKPYFYVNSPTPKLENIIVPYSRIKKHYNDFRAINNHYLPESVIQHRVEEAKTVLFKKFNDSNSKFISYLIKEFELRRNARQFARASVARTGELDMKKIFSYKINEDLFKRMTVVPNGKSHGLIMFVDYSGSMTENLQATIDQTLVLATFCRKVNIPFRVYAFTDDISNVETLAEEMGITDPDKKQQYTLTAGKHRYYRTLAERRPFNKFSSNPEEIQLNDSIGFRLREYLSSEMSSIEFKNASKYWLVVAELYKRRAYSWRSHTTNENLLVDIRCSDFENLNGTPLNETIVASVEIVKLFKEKYRLDVVNTVFLTDGDSNETTSKYLDDSKDAFISTHRIKDVNIIIRDVKRMTEGKKPPRAELTVGLLNLLKASAGVNVIGFFLVAGDRHHRRIIQAKCDTSGKIIENFEEQYKTFKKDKFFMINDVGYDDFYIIPGGDELAIKDDELEVDGTSRGDFKRAFLKMQKSKLVNRVLLNRFISKIA